MAVTNSQHKLTDKLLQRFKTDYPVVTFERSDFTFWDPKLNTIYFNPGQKDWYWSLLHEIGHLECLHSSYSLDVELLIMEKDAWSRAKKLGKKYDIPIDQNYIEDCMDSYRDWLYKRSLCPNCGQTGIQTAESVYTCMNCRHLWYVSVSRFCRSYRKSIKNNL